MTEEYEKGYQKGREDASIDVRTAAFVLGPNVASFAEFLAAAAEFGGDKKE